MSMSTSSSPARGMSATRLLTHVATLQQAVLRRDSEHAQEPCVIFSAVLDSSHLSKGQLPLFACRSCLPGPRSPGLSPVAENFLPQEIGLIFEGQIVSKYSLPAQIFKERCRQCYVCTERVKDNFTAPVMESGVVPGFPGSRARARCQSFNYSTPRCSSKACHQPRAWSLAFCFQAIIS